MRIYFVIACFFLTPPAIGQKHSIWINYKPSLTYLGKQSQTFNNSYFASRKGNETFNHTASILYSYKLSRKIGFTTGVEYSQQGQNINFNADSVFPSSNRVIFKVELNYLRIPLTFNYTIIQKKKAELGIYSGVNMGFAIKRKDNYQDIILEYILLPLAEKRYKEMDWAIPMGINYKKALTSNAFVNIGFEYLFGLTDAFSEKSLSKFGVLSEFANSKQRRLALNLGMGFRLTK